MPKEEQLRKKLWVDEPWPLSLSLMVSVTVFFFSLRLHKDVLMVTLPFEEYFTAFDR